MATGALRIPARDLLTPSEFAALRERVEWKGIALIAHGCTMARMAASRATPHATWR